MLLAWGVSMAEDAPHPGAGVYQEHCSQCHEGGVAKAPHKMFLQMMAPDAIYASMNDGIMQAQSEALSDDERRSVAEYLAAASLDDFVAPALPPSCSAAEAAFDFDKPPASTGWGVSHNNNRYVSPEVAGLDAGDVAKLKLQWAFALPNALRARSEPGIAGGSLFVGSQGGTVYALNAKTGCLRWTFRASAEVRTAIVVSPWKSGDEQARPRLFFGDLLARAYSIDAITGELVWSVKVDDHPNATITGTPTLLGDSVFVPISSLEVTSAADPNYPCCTFRGAVMALSAVDGSILWKQYTVEKPPQEVGSTSVGTKIIAPSGAPIWNSPSVDARAGLLYVGTGENYSSPSDGNSDAIIAMDVATGNRLWTFQATANDAWNVACMLPDARQNCPEENGPDYDFGAATMLVETDDGLRLVAGQKSGEAFGIDPRNGEVVWRNRLGRGGIQAGIHFGMAAMNGIAYVPISDFDDDQEHELPPRPGLFALDAASGKQLWYTPHENNCGDRADCDPGISAPVTATQAAIFGGAMDGVLRAYDPEDGSVIWQFDTAREFDALGGAKGLGGTIGGSSGPVIRDGMLYQTSGYGMYFHMPGNVLLAFAAD